MAIKHNGERAEQIDRAGREAWHNYQQNHNSDTPDHSESFQMGAEWADNNPTHHAHPVLAFRCRKCGCVYLAHALECTLNEKIAEDIAYSAAIGDIAFVTSSDKIKLSSCNCDLAELGERENYNEL